MGKDLTEVRSLQRKLVPDIVGLDNHEPTSLQGIAKKAKACKRHRFRDLYRCLDSALLLHCWDDLNKSAASGVDGVTAAAYAEDLVANVEALVERVKTKRYRAKLVRRCYIPKENGTQRALGIPALEDKLLQSACAKLLSAIYEQDFLASSYGYRPGRGAQDAVRDLTFDLQFGCYGYVVEADVKGFFDHLSHEGLVRMLRVRIDDEAFVGLIRKWLKAGILEIDGSVIHPESGSPQGGSVSPILANVYLHYVLDLWFEKTVKVHCQGNATICRYADDWICAFRYKDDAERFYRVLPKRLAKFNLEVAPEKTRTLRFSRFHPGMKRRTARKKLQAARGRIKEWIRKERHLPKRVFFRNLNTRLRGHYNYYGLRGNSGSLWHFYDWAVNCAFKWPNRRGGKRKSYTWAKYLRMLDYVNIAKPRITEISKRSVLA